MAEIRYNPVIKDWVMIASHRQERPQMPKGWCPFCPGSGKVPQEYDVYCYDNDFPALSQNPPVPDDVATGFFKARPSYGKCEVILYSSDHSKSLGDLEDRHIYKIVELWCERFVELAKDPKILYIYIFENRGEAVGVTMPHPHGQIYAYPFIPKKLKLELSAARQFFNEEKKCLFCTIRREELAEEKRIIFRNKHFTVFLPFYTEYPYGVQIISNKHLSDITKLNKEEKECLGETIGSTVGMLDCLFGYPFPYMMCIHNAPVNGEDAEPFFHFHIEFFPPMRSADKIKYNASSETGAWAHCNPSSPEEKAIELREAYHRFRSI